MRLVYMIAFLIMSRCVSGRPTQCPETINKDNKDKKEQKVNRIPMGILFYIERGFLDNDSV